MCIVWLSSKWKFLLCNFLEARFLPKLSKSSHLLKIFYNNLQNRRFLVIVKNSWRHVKKYNLNSRNTIFDYDFYYVLFIMFFGIKKIIGLISDSLPKKKLNPILKIWTLLWKNCYDINKKSGRQMTVLLAIFSESFQKFNQFKSWNCLNYHRRIGPKFEKRFFLYPLRFLTIGEEQNVDSIHTIRSYKIKILKCQISLKNWSFLPSKMLNSFYSSRVSLIIEIPKKLNFKKISIIDLLIESNNEHC